MPAPPDILIVDDEECISELLADVLGDTGYGVRIAVDGRSALTAVQERVPALILLDNMMPVLSGEDVLRWLRAEGFGHLPIIMMSAASSAEPLLRAGATDFLRKPFHLDDVVDCVSHYLGRPPSQPTKRAVGTSYDAVAE